MPSLGRSKCSDIRIILNFSLLFVLFVTVFITRGGPEIEYFVGLRLPGWGEMIGIYSFSISRMDFFVWSVIDFVLQCSFMYVDFWTFDKIFQMPDDRCIMLKATSVNVLRLNFTFFELALLSQNWTAEIINKFAILGFNWIFRILAVFLEIGLLFQLLGVQLTGVRQPVTEL